LIYAINPGVLIMKASQNENNSFVENLKADGSTIEYYKGKIIYRTKR